MNTFNVIKKPEDSPNAISILQAEDTLRFFNLNDDLLAEISLLEEGIYSSKWMDFILLEELIEIVNEHLLPYYRARRVQKVVLDIREVSVVALEVIMPWLRKEMNPQLEAANLVKYRAVLVSDSAYSQMTGEYYRNNIRADKYVVMQTFTDKKEACNWLRTADKSH